MIILALALVVVGPRRLPEVARTLGKWSRELRQTTRDLRLTLDGLDAGLYASRGQCRTVALAMKLAEAAYLRDERGEEPVLLLDDVLSELDERRRFEILEVAKRYEQCFITTSDPGQVDRSFLKRMTRFVVSDGTVQPFAPTDS